MVWADTATAQGIFILTVLGGLAKYERAITTRPELAEHGAVHGVGA
jgi:hypothetical protein